jgi:uridine monophosphate synthetase
MTKEYITSLKNILLNKFYHLDIIKYGEFTLKSGAKSNIYIDYRKLVNYPQFFNYLEQLIDLMYPTLFQSNDNVKLMPIPMGGLPLGNYLSFAKQIPQVMIRDKPKDHGTKKIIEGIYSREDSFIIVEDVITSGTSIKEALTNLQSHKIDYLEYNAILCICNRGSQSTISIPNTDKTIPIYSIFTLEDIENYITRIKAGILVDYFETQSKFSNELYNIASVKKSNIILSCDFMSDTEILSIIEETGDKLVALKLHLDTITSKGNDLYNYNEFSNKLIALKQRYNFLIIEDAKYADIEAIMYEKIHKSLLMITTIADALTIHAISGLSVLENENIKLPMIIVSEMSSEDNMIDVEYSRKIVKKLNDVRTLQLLGGLVCQNNIPKFIRPFEYLTMSPGINLEETRDNGNQRYKIPNNNKNNKNNKNDKQNKLGMFWIVGRGITKYKNDIVKMQNTMELYCEKGWNYFINY